MTTSNQMSRNEKAAATRKANAAAKAAAAAAQAAAEAAKAAADAEAAEKAKVKPLTAAELADAFGLNNVPAPVAPRTGPNVTPNMLKTLRELVKAMPQGLTRAELQRVCDTTITGYPKLVALGYATQQRGGGKTGQALVFAATASGRNYLASLPTANNTGAPSAAPGLITEAATNPAPSQS